MRPSCQTDQLRLDNVMPESDLHIQLESEQNIVRRQELLKDLWRLARHSSDAGSDLFDDQGQDHE
jgi:hypothetical protein